MDDEGFIRSMVGLGRTYDLGPQDFKYLLGVIDALRERAERAEKFCQIFGEHRDKLTGFPRVREWFSARDRVFSAWAEWKEGAGMDPDRENAPPQPKNEGV